MKKLSVKDYEEIFTKVQTIARRLAEIDVEGFCSIDIEDASISVDFSAEEKAFYAEFYDRGVEADVMVDVDVLNMNDEELEEFYESERIKFQKKAEKREKELLQRELDKKEEYKQHLKRQVISVWNCNGNAAMLEKINDLLAS